MNKDYLDKFISRIDHSLAMSDEKNCIKDRTGACLNPTVLRDLVREASELLAYGESKIALENILENLNEVSAVLDQEMIDLAHQAFGNQITDGIKSLLLALAKNETLFIVDP